MKRSRDLLWMVGPAVVIFAPFFGLPGIMDMREAQMNFFQCVIFLWFILYLPKPVGVFLSYALIHLLITGIPPEAAKMFQMITLAAGFFLLVKHSAGNHLKGWFYAFFIFALLNTAWVTLQMNGIRFYFLEGPEREGTNIWIGHAGIMGQRVFSGALSAMISPILFYIHPLLLPIAMLALWQSWCTAALVGFLPALCVTLFFVERKAFYFALPVLFIGAFFFLKKDFAPGMHIDLLRFSYPLVKNQLFGNGLGSFSEMNILWTHAQMVYKQAHNDTFQIFFEYGAAGLFLFLCIVNDVFKKFMEFKSDKAIVVLFSSMLAFYITSFGQPVFHVARTAMPAVALAALFYSRYENLKRSTP